VDWQMIGAIGEVLGAAAVVVTLFYLAREVREASREAQRNRWSDLNNDSRDGGLHLWGAEGGKRNMTDILGFPGVKRYWNDRRLWFSLDFRREVDAIVDEAAPVMLDAYGPRG